MNKRLKDIITFNAIFIFSQILMFNSRVFPQINNTWNKTFGTELYDDANNIVNTSDNGYILVGTSQNQSSNSRNMFIVRTDSVGDTIWTKRIGENNWAEGRALIKDKKDEFLAAGEYYSNSNDVWVIKFNEIGNILWEEVYQTDSMETVSSIVSSGDSSFVLVGSTQYWPPNSDVIASELLLMKIDSLGNQVWLRNYIKDSLWVWNVGRDVKKTSDGGFIIVAESNSFNSGGSAIWLLKTDSVGDTIWTKLYYKEDSQNVVRSIHQTLDGGYIIGGMVKQFGNHKFNAWIIKTNDIGDIIWERLYGNIETSEGANALIQLEDSTYVFTGYTSGFPETPSDLWLVKLNVQGDTIWTKSIGGMQSDNGNDLVQSSEGGYAIAGRTKSFGAGGYDAWLVKTDSSGNVVVSIDERIYTSIPNEFALMPNFPNPFNPMTNISYSLPVSGDVTLIIYNLLGEEVTRLVDGFRAAGEYNSTWDASNFASGIYFYRLQAGDFVQTRKIMLLK